VNSACRRRRRVGRDERAAGGDAALVVPGRELHARLQQQVARVARVVVDELVDERHGARGLAVGGELVDHLLEQAGVRRVGGDEPEEDVGGLVAAAGGL
jgi:hypothetical protein